MTEHHDNTSNEAPASTEANETPPAGTSVPPEPQNGSQADPNKSLAEANRRYVSERDEARAERDSLQARIEGMQRAEIERLAADALSVPGDLLSLSGNAVADYLTESGDVDAAKVAADVAAVLAERPGLQRPKHPAGYDPSQGTGGAPADKGTTWADLFKP